MDRRLSNDVVTFIHTHLGSIWALELMLLMMAQPEKAWTIEMLVRELRATHTLVAGLLERFQRSELATETPPGTWRWSAATDELRHITKELAAAHAVTPFAVIQAIANAPELRLRQFADAFRIRKD
jgi:hypothetical protein